MKTIEDLGDLAGLRVLVRSDLNVPIKNDVIGDDGRIRASRADAGEAGQGRRQGDRDRAPRPPEGHAEPGVHARPGGQAAR